MAVVLDAASAAVTVGASPTSPQTTTVFTVGTGANRVLLVGVGFSASSTLSGVTMNWDSTGTNQAMTLIASSGLDGLNAQSMLFGLRNPTSGNKTLRLAWSSGTITSFCLGIIAFTGADQAADATTFRNAVHSVTASVASPYTATINSVTGDFAVAYFSASTASFSTAATGTIFGNSNTNVSAAGIDITGGGASTALSVNVGSGTGTAANQVGCDIAAVSSVAVGSTIAVPPFFKPARRRQPHQVVFYASPSPLFIPWFEPFTDPVRTAPRAPDFPAAPYFETAQFPETVTESRWHQPWVERPSVPPPRAPYFESCFWAESAPFPETVTESRWHQPWSEPVRQLPRAPEFEQPTLDPFPFAVTTYGAYQSPIIWRSRTLYQVLAEPTAARELLTLDNWYRPLNEPVRVPPRAPDFPPFFYSESAQFPETVTEPRWHQPLSEPVRVAARAPDFPEPAWIFVAPTTEIITVDKWFAPWREQPPPAARSPYLEAAPYFETAQFPETVTESRWHQPWSEPVRQLPRSPYFEPFFYDPKDFSPSMGWYQAWREAPPPRPKSPDFPHHGFDPKDFTPSMGWYQALREPVRSLPRAIDFPHAGFDPKDFTPSMGWFQAWREQPPPAPRSPEFPKPAWVFVPPPEVITIDKWFQPWREPRPIPRSPDFPPPAWGVFTPAQVLPTTFGVLAAIEQRDVFAGAIATKSLFGVMETRSQRDQAHVIGWTGSVSVGISQTFPALP